MSIWNVPVCAPRSATPTGNAGLPLNAGCYGVALTEEPIAEACAACDAELTATGDCLACLAASESTERKRAAAELAPEVLSALADVLENGGSFPESLELALREARCTTATRVANRMPDSGVHVSRAGDAALRINVAGVVFTVTVSS